MKRRVMALFLATVTAVSQVAGGTSVAVAADIIVEEPMQISEEIVDELVISDAEIASVEEADAQEDEVQMEELAEELEEADSADELAEEPEESGSAEGTVEESETADTAEEEAADQESADSDEIAEDVSGDAGENPEQEGTVSDEETTANTSTDELDVNELNLGEEIVMSIELVDEAVVETLELGAEEEDAEEEETEETQLAELKIGKLRDSDNNYTWLFIGESQTYTVDLDSLVTDGIAESKENLTVYWNITAKEGQGPVTQYVIIPTQEETTGEEGSEDTETITTAGTVTEAGNLTYTSKDGTLTLLSSGIDTPEGDTVQITATVVEINDTEEAEGTEKTETALAEGSAHVDVRYRSYEYMLPGYQEYIPGDSIEIGNTIEVFVQDPEHPTGDTIETSVTEVKVNVYDGDQNAVNCTANTDEDENTTGWELSFNGPCLATVSMTYVDVGDEANTQTGEFDICVEGEIWGIDVDSDSGTNQLLPGNSLDLIPCVWMQCYEDGRSYQGDASKVVLEWTYTNKAFTIADSENEAWEEENCYLDRISVTAPTSVSDNASERLAAITFSAYRRNESGEATGNPLIQREYTVEVCGGYYNLEPIAWDWQGLEPGETSESFLPELYFYGEFTGNDGESYQDKELITSETDDVQLQYRWYGDSEIVALYEADDTSEEPEALELDWENGVVTTGAVKIKKLNNHSGSIVVVAEIRNSEEEDYEEAARRTYWLNGRNYSCEFQENWRGDGYSWLYPKDEITLYLDTCNLQDENGDLRDNVSIEWQIGYYENDEFTTVSSDTKSGDSIVLKESELRTAGFGSWEWVNVQAVIKINDIPVEVAEYPGIEIREAEYYLHFEYNGDLETFPYYDHWLNRNAECEVHDDEYWNGENLSATITDVKITDPDSEEEKDSDVVTVTDENNDGYNLHINDFGAAKVTVSYTVWEGETEYHKDTQDFYIYVNGERYGIGIDSDTGYNQLLPGRTLGLNANVSGTFWTEEDGEQGVDIDAALADGFWIEWECRTEGYEDLIEFEPDEENPYRCNVTAHDDISGEQIWVRVCLKDQNGNERASCEYDIWINEVYYKVEAYPNIKRYRELEVGTSVDVNPVLYKYELVPVEEDGTVTGYEESVSKVTEDITWKWEDWDSERVKITDAGDNELSPEDNNNTGTAPFTLEKLSAGGTDLKLVAYMGEKQDEYMAEEWWSFGELNYETWYEGLRENNYTWIYADETDANYTINLNDDNLYNRNVELEWQIGYWNEEEEFVMASEKDADGNGQYTVKNDGMSIELDGPAIQAWLESENQGSHFEICTNVYAAASGEKVYEMGIGADVAEARIDYPEGYGAEENRMAGEWIGVNAYSSYFEENGNYPYGQHHDVLITDVKIELSEDSPEDAIECERVINEDDNGWSIYLAKECEADITIYYMRTSDGEEMSYTTHLNVGTEWYGIWFDDGAEARKLFTGDSVELTAHLARAVSFEEYNSDLTNVVFDWEVTEGNDAVTLKEDLTDIRNNSCTITAGSESGKEAVIKVRAYLCETDESGAIKTNDDGSVVLESENSVTETEVRIYVDQYKIEEVSGKETDQEQYIMSSLEESVTICPVLKEGTETYSGRFRYRWEDYDEGQIQISKKEIELSSQKEGELPEFTITRVGNDWTNAVLCAEMRDGYGNWYEVARKEWYFNNVNTDIGFENTRGDGETWVFEDEEDYTLSVGTGENFLAAGNEIFWTIGLCGEDGFLEEYLLPAENDGAENSTVYYSVNEDTTEITLNGAAVKSWLAGIAESEAEYPEEDKVLNKTVICIRAQAVRTVEIEDSDPEIIYLEGEGTDIGIDLRVEDNYEYWEDENIPSILVGGKLSYINGIYHREVRNQEWPWGYEYEYKLADITSSNTKVLEPIYDSATGDWYLQANAVGEAEITYSFVDDVASKTFMKSVVDMYYDAQPVYEFGTGIMPTGSEQLLDLELVMVTPDEKSALDKSVYEVSWESWNEDILTVEQVYNDEEQTDPAYYEDGSPVMKAVAHNSGDATAVAHVTIWETETDEDGNVTFVQDADGDNVIANELDFEIYFNVRNLEYEELYGGDGTWMFREGTYTLSLREQELFGEMQKADGMSILWQAGCFDDDGNLVASLTESEGDTEGQYTIADDGLSITFDGPAVSEWLEDNGDESWFEVRTKVIFTEEWVDGEEQGTTEWIIAETGTSVGVETPELSCPGDLSMEEFRLGGSGHFINVYTGYSERNADHPYGTWWDGIVTNVEVSVEEGPQKAVTCTRVQNEWDNGWELSFNSECEATVTISFVRSADGARMTFDVHVTVGSDCYNIWFEEGMAQKHLLPEETFDLNAYVIHEIAYADSVKNPEYVVVNWNIPEESEVIAFVTDTTDEATSLENQLSCKVKAIGYGEENVTADVYLYELDEEGNRIKDDDENYILSSEPVASATVSINVSDYRIEEYVDEAAGISETQQEQYLLPGESVTIYPVLSDGETVYTGDIHYYWRYDGNQVEISPNEMNVSGTDSAAFTITKWSEDWTDVALVAGITDSNGNYQEFSRQWFFNSIDRSIWYEDTREDGYTWLFEDEMYTLSVGTGDGLLENGRNIQWTVGMLNEEGFTDAIVPYNNDTVTDDGASEDSGDTEAAGVSEDENSNSGNVYSISDDTTAITIDGSALKTWYDNLSEEERRDAGIHARAWVELQDGDYTEKVIWLELRKCSVTWEDSNIETIMQGRQFRYDGAQFTCTIVNGENPDGAGNPYLLLGQEETVDIIEGAITDDNSESTISGIISSNPDVLCPEYTAATETESAVWTITAVGEGEATITYTYWTDQANGEYEQISFDKRVTAEYYDAEASYSTGTNRMLPGDSQQILLDVFKYQINTDGSEERITIPAEEYSVRYESTDTNMITVKRDGKVTVSNENYGGTWVNVYITIPQYAEDGSEIEPVELECGVEFYIQNYYYQIDTMSSYIAAKGESIEIQPQVFLMEEGEEPLWFENAEIEVTEEGSELLNITSDEDGNYTIEAKDGGEASATIKITAHADKDDFGYELNEEAWCQIVFCEHSWGEAFDYHAPECGVEGYYSHICTKCGLEDMVYETALVHAWDSGVIKAGDEPTCAKTGLKTFTCTREGCTATKTGTVAKTTSHAAGSWTVTKAATCSAEGTKVQKCTLCGTQTASASIAKLAHTPGSWTTTVNATCTAAGTQVQKCTACGATTATKAIAAKGHSWGAYTVTKQPTAIEEGWQVHKCSCGASQGTAVAKLTPTIKLTATKLAIQLNKSANIKSIVTGLAEGDYITGWTTSDKKVVTVNSSGKITGKKVNKSADITVTLKSGLTATVKVTVQKKAVATTKVTVENVVKNKVTLTKGSSMTLVPVITPVTSLDKATYKTSNKKVVTVTNKGKIKAVGSGKATITIKAGKKSVKVTVTVPKVQPTKITGVTSAKTLKVGKTLTLKPKLYPAGSEATIKYTTSNKKVATVTAKGKITAKKKGTAVITVKAGSVTATCTITVK